LNAVVVLGGSFDPVHRGHVELAVRARQLLGLEHAFLLPCSDPPHKPDRALAARYHRLEMLYLAAEDRPGVRISTFELARGGVCFTVDTLRGLRKGAPSVAPVFVCGSDALADIGSWREHEALLSEFDFAAVIRPREVARIPDLDWPELVTRRVRPLPPDGPPIGAGGRVFRMDLPMPSVSSSLVRARCVAGQSVDDLVPARVARYIQRHRLYSEEAPR